MVKIEFKDTKGAVWGLDTAIKRIMNISGHVQSPLNEYHVVFPRIFKNGAKLEVIFKVKTSMSTYRKEMLVIKEIIGIII